MSAWDSRPGRHAKQGYPVAVRHEACYTALFGSSEARLLGDKHCADLPNLEATAAAAQLVVRKWNSPLSTLPRISSSSLFCTTYGLADKG